MSNILIVKYLSKELSIFFFFGKTIESLDKLNFKVPQEGDFRYQNFKVETFEPLFLPEKVFTERKKNKQHSKTTRFFASHRN